MLQLMHDSTNTVLQTWLQIVNCTFIIKKALALESVIVITSNFVLYMWCLSNIREFQLVHECYFRSQIGSTLKLGNSHHYELILDWMKLKHLFLYNNIFSAYHS